MLKNMLTGILMIVVTGAFVLFFVKNYDNYMPKGELPDYEVEAAFSLLFESLETPRQTYIDFLKNNRHVLKTHLSNQTAVLMNADQEFIQEISAYAVVVSKNETATYEVSVPSNGLYRLRVGYFSEHVSLNDQTLAVRINGEHQYEESKTINIPMIWSDESKVFSTDRYGDQVLPNQTVQGGWRKVDLFNNTYVSVESLLFLMKTGSNSITFTNTSSTQIQLATLELIAPRETIDYESYDAMMPDHRAQTTIFVNATTYSSKNSSYVHLYSYNSPHLTPHDPIYKKLNVIDGNSWRHSGQEVTYDVFVPESGRYKIAVHYSNGKNDFPSFRSISINGSIPFDELHSYAFAPTGNNKWALETLHGETGDFWVYLDAGLNTIRIKAESEPLENALRNMQLVIDHINMFSLEVRKITGKEVDRNRTWVLTQYIPETPLYLDAYELLLKQILTELSVHAPNGSLSSTLSYIQKALYKVNLMQEDPDKLPLYVDDLFGGTGSVAQYLGDSLAFVREQPMYLNGFHLHHDVTLGRANATFFTNAWASLQAFLSSFTSDKYKMTQDPEVIDVWVNRPITYVDIMQKMVDQQFTAQTGIKVKVSVMPDPNKLIMASAAGQQPDVALGLLSYMPFDLAIRSAAYDLSSFPDYWEYANQFTPGALVPYILNDNVYAIPETLDFNVVMYRKDIFESLTLTPPDSWDEVIDLLPELQRYGMNFYHPIAGGGSLKWFYQTSSLIYQHGGSLYAENGAKSAINTRESIAGLTYLNKMFTNYSLPEQVPSFYNSFRYGTLPIGIADFNTYLLIKNAAPELIGQWDIAPYPKVTLEDGTSSRYYIANGSAGVMLQSTDRPEDSWEFLKWWMSTETQTQFAFTLQSTYGPSYTWLSANLNAFEQSTLPEADKDIIRSQVEWLRDVPRTPGQYMLERSISDIWNTAVFDGTPTGIAVDRYTIVIDREIRKKMIEFGFLDRNGNEIIPYVIRDVDWIRLQMRIAIGEEE